MINLSVWVGVLIMVGFIGLCTGSLIWVYKYDNKKKQGRINEDQI